MYKKINKCCGPEINGRKWRPPTSGFLYHREINDQFAFRYPTPLFSDRWGVYGQVLL